MANLTPEYNLDDPWSDSYADNKIIFPNTHFGFADTRSDYLKSPFCTADSTPPTEIIYPKPPFCCPDVDFIKRPPIAMDEETTKEAQLLQDELDRLENDIRVLQSQKTNLLSDLATLEREDFEAMGLVVTPSKPHVVAFVSKLEQAHLYFKFKEFLKKSDLLTYDTDPNDDFVNHLFANQQGMAEFDKLERPHIQTALRLRIEELRKTQGFPKFREGFKRYKQQYCPGWGDTTHVSEAEQELESRFPTLSLGSEEVVDQFVIVNPFFNLLHRMRSENYIMNEDPALELGEVMKCFPLAYQDSELVCDPLRLMTPPPDMGSNVDEVFTKAVDKYKQIIKEGKKTKKRRRSMSSEGSSMLHRRSLRLERLASAHKKLEERRRSVRLKRLASAHKELEERR